MWSLYTPKDLLYILGFFFINAEPGFLQLKDNNKHLHKYIALVN